MPTKAPATIQSAAWHARPAADAVRELDVDPAAGLSSAEVQRRVNQYGPNRLAEAPKQPQWRAFLRQFQDLLIIILLIAAVVSLLVSRRVGDSDRDRAGGVAERDDRFRPGVQGRGVTGRAAADECDHRPRFAGTGASPGGRRRAGARRRGRGGGR